MIDPAMKKKIFMAMSIAAVAMLAVMHDRPGIFVISFFRPHDTANRICQRAATGYNSPVKKVVIFRFNIFRKCCMDATHVA